MQVYNNNATASVWKSYTANASNLRGSIARLSSGLKSAREDNPTEVSLAQSLRSKYREAASSATEVESRINSLQTTDAWLQKSQTVLSEMSEVASGVATRAEVGSPEGAGRFELMQEELSRIGQKENRRIFVPATSDQGSTVEGTASAPETPPWFNALCDSSANPSTPESAAAIVDAVNSGFADIDDRRGVVGEEAKRLESTLAELRSHVANIRATENRIGDPELAMETIESAAGSIMTQVGTAMLAQANALPGSVMTLIKPAAG